MKSDFNNQDIIILKLKGKFSYDRANALQNLDNKERFFLFFMS